MILKANNSFNYYENNSIQLKNSFKKYEIKIFN